MRILKNIFRTKKRRLVMKGEFHIRIFDEDGNLKEEGRRSNVITDDGLDWIVEFGFDSVTPTVKTRMSHIAIGSDNTAESNSDTALGAELARAAFDNWAAGGTGICTIDATFGAGVGTGTINEIGVFNDAAAGQMWNRTVFDTPYTKGASDVAKITVIVSISEDV